MPEVLKSDAEVEAFFLKEIESAVIAAALKLGQEAPAGIMIRALLAYAYRFIGTAEAQSREEGSGKGLVLP